MASSSAAFFALLVTLASSLPTTERPFTAHTSYNNYTVIDAPPLHFKLKKILTVDHDIVNILFPFNGLNVNDGEANKLVIFYTEADVIDGKRDYKGLSVYNTGTVTKILETGTSAATGKDKVVYIGAADGIYIYNSDDNTAEKFGTINDNIIAIEMAYQNGTDDLYILNNIHELYKATEGGTKKQLIANKVEQFLLDISNNVYYYTGRKFYVVSKSGTVLAHGLPSNPGNVHFMKPENYISEANFVVVDNKMFIIHKNGTVEGYPHMGLALFPTHSADAVLVKYFAFDKGIYEYNECLEDGARFKLQKDKVVTPSSGLYKQHLGYLEYCASN